MNVGCRFDSLTARELLAPPIFLLVCAYEHRSRVPLIRACRAIVPSFHGMLYDSFAGGNECAFCL